MTGRIQQTLSQLLQQKGVRVLGFHGSFYGPAPIAKEIIPMLRLLMLPHRDLEPLFGENFPRGFARVTGAPFTERLALEYRMLRASKNSKVSKHGPKERPESRYPSLAFMRSANVVSDVVWSYFEDCSVEDGDRIEGVDKSRFHGESCESYPPTTALDSDTNVANPTN